MTPEVELAIAEIKAALEGHEVEVDPEPQGGAYVIVHNLPIGVQYAQSTSWVGFLITFQYPRADVYPHYIDSQVKRKDGQPLGESFSGTMDWHNRQAIQVSRRSNRLNPAVDTAATKLAKVLDWIASR